MSHHVVVDGSNLATEGRSLPSLAQLNEAVMAFMAEHPEALITVVVDATFGHRIDRKETAEFDDAVANNELVAPPAGAVGRGDAFVLSIANKVGATILSNDSYQEFHGQYDWLFDEGRLVGGKPVPHIGWVFVPRTPVRGPISRSAVKDAKRKKPGGDDHRGKVRQGSPEASKPMPVPKAPPPGARQSTPKAVAPKAVAPKERVRAASPAAPATVATKATVVNDLLPFLSFVEHHPVGTSVNAVVENYSSHGAYVRVGDVKGYVPLRLMADPVPRSAREFMKIGDAVTLVVDSFAAARRSIDLAVVGMSVATPPAPRKSSAKSAATKQASDRKAAAKPAAKKSADKPAEKKAAAKSGSATTAKRAATSKAATSKAATKPVAMKPVAMKPVAGASKPDGKAAPGKAATKKAAPGKAATKKADAKKADAKKATAKKATAKKAGKVVPTPASPGWPVAAPSPTPTPAPARRRRPS